MVRYGSPPEEAAPVTLGPCHANVGGFDLHGGIVVPAGQRERLERLCHYPLAWLAIVCAAILSAAGFPRLTFAWRFAGSMAALLLAPALVLAQLTVHNASAVLFPAWVPLGHSRPRGLDAIGQPLILFGAVVVTLAFMMIPGVLVSAILWFAFQPFLGAAVLIPCAIACLGLVAVEVIAATEVLGPAYEKMDLLSAERAE